MAEARLNRRYRRLERLAGGGEGEVFLVEDGRKGPRRVLKALRALEPDAIVRLAGEFKRLAALDHPAIVRVHELEVADDGGFLAPGTPFFTAEEIPGTPADVAARAVVGPARAALVWRIGVQLAAGLAHLHAAGLRHRDVKPANVITCADGRAVLIDLGLALARDAHGLAAGTPGYVAPEELFGAADERADLFGLGATLFELAAGRPAFPPTAGDALHAAITGAHPALAPLAPDLPPAFATLIEALLAPDAAARPSSATVVLDALEAIREGAGYPEVAHARAAAGLGAPVFVGHTDALATLGARLDALARGTAGAGGLLRLVGPAGAGKSRLVAEAVRRWQLSAATATAAGTTAATPAPPRLELLGPDVATIRTRAGVPADARPRALTAALTATARPRVIHLGDGADPEAAALARTLLAAGDAPVLTIIELTVDDPLDPTDVLAVAPLGDDAVHTLSAAMLGHAPAPAWSAALARATGGLPGLVVLALRVAAARGSTPRAIEAADPSTLVGPLADALAELHVRRPADERAVAAALAVLGPSSIDTLARVAELAPVAAAAALGGLLAAGLVAPLPSGARPISPAHADAALAALSPPQRRALHTRALAVDHTDPEARARHMLGAASAASAVGDACLAAAAHARAAGRVDAALAWLEEALPRVSAANRPAVALTRAELALSVARYEVALAAAELATAGRDPARHRRAGLVRCRALARRGDTTDALTATRALLATTPTDAPEHEALSGLAARLLVLAGSPADALALIGRPDEERPPDRDHVAGRGARLEAAALVAFYAGDGPRTEALAAALVALARAHDDAALAARGLGLWALARQRAGDPVAAAAHFTAALDAARTAGDPHLAATSALGLAGAKHDLGEPGAVLDATRDALLELARLGRPRELASTLVNRAIALIAFGDVDAARRALDAATAHASDQPRVQTWIALVESDLARRQGAPTRALAAARRAAQLAHDQHAHASLAHATIAELLAEQGDPSGSTAALAAAATTAASDDELDRVALATARAALHGVGDPIAARARVLAAATRFTQTHRRSLAWRADALASRLGDPNAAARARSTLDALIALAPEPRRPGLANDPEALALAAAPAPALPAPASASPSAPVWPPPASASASVSSSAASASRLPRILALAKRLNSELRLDHLLDDVIDAMIELTLAERGFLLLGPPGKLQIRVARNIDQRALDGTELALSRSIAERAAAAGEPVVTIDAATDERFGAAASVSALRLRSVLAVPLVAAGRPIGCVYVDHRVRRGVFSDDDVALVCDLADVAAIALENARLAEENTTRAAEVTALATRLEAELADKSLELGAVRAALGDDGPALRHRYDDLIGRSPRMLELLRVCDRASASALPVFIHGESGTGKELVARALHAHGPRAGRAFVPVNCGAVPDALLEPELFGHERGAFTGADRERRGLFEVADGGTLFLDEIGDTSPAMQVKLLRALQSGEIRRVGGDRARTVDVRIVAASHQDLSELVRLGRFREDLYYRLHVIRLDVPALRDRAADIPVLAQHILERHAHRIGRPTPRLHRDALARLLAHPWPGNVRELENELARAVALGGATIGLADLSPAIAAADPQAPPIADDDLSLKPRVERLERSLIADALARARGNQTVAARTLGLSRFGLQKKLKRYGL